MSTKKTKAKTEGLKSGAALAAETEPCIPHPAELAVALSAGEPDLEDRISDLQAEINRLRAALEWVDRHADVPWLEKFRSHARRALSGNA